MSTLPARVELSADVLVQEVNGEAVLLDFRTETYFGLNEVGVRLWRLLESRGEPQAAVEAIVAEYDVDEATVVRDVHRLLTGLESKGLLRVL